MTPFNLKYLLTLLVVVAVTLSIKETPSQSKTSGETGINVGGALASDSGAYVASSIDSESQSVLVQDLSNGKTVFRFTSDKRWPLASLTKLMTALVAFELMPPNKKIILTKEAILTEGASGNFSEGEEFTLSDLIKAMLLVSSNDASRAIALDYGEERFVKIMNDKAKDLGMLNTEFIDPAGLSLKNQGTAEDLEKLVDFIWKNEPAIFAITRTAVGEIADVKTGERRELRNINLFSGQTQFLGGKTGTMPSVGGNLISIFDISGAKAIIVLGAVDKFAGTEKIIEALWPKKL